ncbi:MAG: hypothetical protein AAFV80_01140 [Bacteroidota bacterium]
MKPYQINLVNAIVLILIGLWGAQASDAITGDGSKTAFIPVIFGVIFLACHPMFKKENKAVAHIVVLFTFLFIVAMAGKPLPAAINSGDNMRILRTVLMILSSVVAMVIYIKSFRDARKAKS